MAKEPASKNPTPKSSEPTIVLKGLAGWFFHRLGVPPWGQITALAIVVLGAELAHIELRLERIDTQLLSVPLQISSALVSQAARQATNRQYEDATRTLQSASALVEQARENHINSKGEYFERQVKLLSGIDVLNHGPLASQVSQFRVVLASYRSQLNPPPKLPSKRTETLPALTARTVLEASAIYSFYAPVYTRPNIDLVGSGYSTLQAHFTDRDMLIPSTRLLETNHETVSGMNLMDGMQTLDGFSWDNVTFVNMHIRYSGGTAQLSNVRFVNCTFDLPPDGNGNSIADYAALGDTRELKIG